MVAILLVFLSLILSVAGLNWITDRFAKVPDPEQDAFMDFIELDFNEQEKIKNTIGIRAYLELVAKTEQERAAQEKRSVVKFDPEQQRIEWGDWSLENQRN